MSDQPTLRPFLFSFRLIHLPTIATIISLLLAVLSSIGLAQKLEPPPALEIRPLEQTSIAAWKQPRPLTLPESSREAFFKNGDRAPAIAFDRLIAHLPTKLRSILLFPAAADELKLDALPAQVRLAHDGENLLIFLHLGLIPGRTTVDSRDLLGHWPMRKAPFDNRECVMIAAATGSPENVPQRAVFIDWKGNVEWRHSNGTGPVTPMPDQSGTSFPKKSIVTKSGWTVIASIPFSALFGEEKPTQHFSLNVARLYSAPEGKLAPRAASLAGSFYAFRRFPVFSVGPRENEADPQLLGLKLGDFPKNGQVPMGSHRAEAVLISETADTVLIRHRLRSETEGKAIAMEREIELRPGVNRFQWEWTSPQAANFASTLEINGQALASETLTTAPRLETQPSLFVARTNETLSLHTNLGLSAKETRKVGLLAELLENGKPLHRFKLPRPSGPVFDLDLHLARLPSLKPGSHTLRVTALKGEAVWATSEAPFQVEPAAPAPRKKLEIALQDASYRSASQPHPVRTGIPFPEGALVDASRLQLIDKEGRAVPFAVTPVAQWPRTRSVKWVHLDFEHDPAQSYRLVSPPVTQTTFQPGVRITESRETLRVDTGALSVTVGKKGFDGFHVWQLGKGKPHRPAPGSFYAIDQTGLRFDSRHGEGITEVEEANDERVTLKFSGPCTANDAAGEAPSPLRYLMRMTFYRNAPIIEVRHSFTITTHTSYHRLRRIGLHLGLAPDAVELDGASLPPLKAGSPIAIRQTHPQQRLLIDKGERREIDATARGEFRWKTPSAAIGLNILDFREMAPLEVVHRSGEGLELRLWPGFSDKAPSTVATSDAEKIRLPFLHHGPLLDFEVPESYLDESRTSQQRYYLLNGLTMADAMGVSRSQRFELVFHPASEAETLPARAQTWFAHPYVTASPRWMSESGALTSLPMAPAAPDSPIPAVARAEQVLSRSFDWERRHTVAHTMGKWTWGAMHSGWDPATQAFTLYRPFRNSHHRSTRAYYYFFARSGDPKYLELAERATDYINDLGMPRHTDSDLEELSYYGKRIGGTCDYKGFVPWNSGSRFDYNTYAENFLNSWYLTGNPDSLQAVTQLHTLALEERLGSSGIGRVGASRMETVGSLYNHFRDGRLLGYLHRSFDDLAASQLPQGFIPGGVEFSTWLPEYIELTSRPEAVSTLRKLAYADLKYPDWYDFQGKTWQPNLDLQAYAYRRFGDPALLSQVTRRMVQTVLDSVYLKEGDPEDGSMASYNVRWSFFANQAPALLWALSKAGMPQWETPRVTYLDYRVPREWTTIAAFKGAQAEPFDLVLKGDKSPKAVVRWRIVAGNGALLSEGVLEGLKLPQLPLSNPPVDPPVMTRKIVPAHPAPYFLQLSGSDNYLRLMTPYTSLEKEVYAGGDFYSKGGGASRKGHFRFSYRYGNRPLYLQVAHGASQGDLKLIVGTGQPYRIGLYSQEAKRPAVTEGFVRGPSLQVSLPLNAVAQEKAEVVGIQPNVGSAIVTLEGGRNVQPWIGLSRETFFVPENLPTVAR